MGLMSQAGLAIGLDTEVLAEFLRMVRIKYEDCKCIFLLTAEIGHQSARLAVARFPKGLVSLTT
jgi:hypothetical protein